MNILNFSQPSTGNFLVDIIVWLVSISSSIAVGIVLFTIILKLITLPFDYVSRASMRKNSLKMEEMRPELEKLQEQYANDKALYQQKMMALYKKNGYSMFGACLPTILTLVIFIVALNGFTNFSKYQNRLYFYNMSTAYNNVIYAGLDIDHSENGYIIRDEDGKLVAKDEELLNILNGGTATVEGLKQDGTTKFEIYLDKGTQGAEEYLQITTENSYIQYKRFFTMKDVQEGENTVNKAVFSNHYEFSVIESKITADNPLCSEENNFLAVYQYDIDGNIMLDDNGKELTLNLAQAKTYYDQLNQQKIELLKQEKATLEAEGEDVSEFVIPEFKAFTANDFILDIRQEKSAEKYHEEKATLWWIKNIWVTDSACAHPVESSWENFKSTQGYGGTEIGDDGYASLTAKLANEKDAPNGYFILVILTAGISLLTQLVMSKSQKAQMELQTVDGQGAQTQRIMTIIMPIMMAVFAFMYTSAFSIYIILSSIISLGTTLGINKIVDIKFKKEKAKKEGDSTKIRGRVYTPKKEEQPKEDKKSKKAKKNAETNTADFLSGTADKKKHIRGRLK